MYSYMLRPCLESTNVRSFKQRICQTFVSPLILAGELELVLSNRLACVVYIAVLCTRFSDKYWERLSTCRTAVHAKPCSLLILILILVSITIRRYEPHILVLKRLQIF